MSATFVDLVAFYARGSIGLCFSLQGLPAHHFNFAEGWGSPPRTNPFSNHPLKGSVLKACQHFPTQSMDMQRLLGLPMEDPTPPLDTPEVFGTRSQNLGV